MSTITLGANIDFGAKELQGSTYKYATSAGGTAASWSGSTTLTTLGSALDTDLYTAVGQIVGEVNGKISSLPASISASTEVDTPLLKTAAIREKTANQGLTIGKEGSPANGDTWIEIDSSNHVCVKGLDTSGNAVTLVTFAA